MEIKTKLIETTFLHPSVPHGYGNGYIGLPKEHPWYGLDYGQIDVDIHGGLTYCDDHAPYEQPDGYWWVGFDTNHYMDNKFNCSKAYCENQIESLKKQAEEAIIDEVD